MSSQQKVAFIGLGAMGYPMAGHLQRNGFDVCVYNRTETKAFAWVDEFGGTSAPTPAEAAVDASVVFLCVGNDSDVRAVASDSEGVLSTMTQVPLWWTTQLHRERACGRTRQRLRCDWCPILGCARVRGQAGAENGVLTVMVGGKQAHFDCVEPIMRSFAKHVQLMGDVGSGQTTKMVNQLAIAGILGGLSEALHFAECAGLDIDEVTTAIQGGAAQSWQMNNRAHRLWQSESMTLASPSTGCARISVLRSTWPSGLVFIYRSQRWSILSTPMCKKTAVVDGILRG